MPLHTQVLHSQKADRRRVPALGSWKQLYANTEVLMEFWLRDPAYVLLRTPGVQPGGPAIAWAWKVTDPTVLPCNVPCPALAEELLRCGRIPESRVG